MSEKNRYSDEELQEFKTIIASKLEKAKFSLSLLMESQNHRHENGTDDTGPTYKVLEESRSVLSKEENEKFVARQEKFIKSLENALVRIQNKTYGVCQVTGKLIPKQRLQSVPHTTHSIEGKQVEEKRKKMAPVEAEY